MPDPINKKWVYLPCEVEHRDVYHRTLLAVALAHKGYACVVGSKNDIIRHGIEGRLPPGLFTHKDASYLSLWFIKALREKGFRYAAMDEEALAVFKGDIEHVDGRISEEVMTYADLFFAACEREFETIKQRPYYPKVRLTGTPKFDVYREGYRELYRQKAQEYKNRFSKFIFIPSNFGMGDQKAFDDDLANMLKPYEGKDNYQWMHDYYYTIQMNRHRSAYAYIEFVRDLAGRFPDTRIVFRPHQADDQNLWRNGFGNCPNVTVLLEGIVAPWLMAAEVIIHNGCTTAVEASLMDINTIAYVPIVDEGLYLDEPAFAISHIIKDFEELCTEIKRRYKAPMLLDAEKRRYIHDIVYLESKRDEQKFRANFDIIVNDINTIDYSNQLADLSKIRVKIAWLNFKNAIYDGRERVKQFFKPPPEVTHKTKFQNRNMNYGLDIARFYSNIIDPTVKIRALPLDRRVFFICKE